MHLTVYCKMLVVYPNGHTATWEPRLTDALQHHETVSYCILLAQEKIQFQNSKYSFYWMGTAFVPLWSQIS